MRIVTWNVNSLRVRLPRVLQFLAEHRPDIVCLQETKCAPDGFPAAELDAAGYGAVHHSGGRWAGVALLARQGLELADPLLGLPGDPVPDEARWCEATIGGLRCASVYVPNGRTLDSPEFPRKLAFLDAVADRVGALAGTGGGGAGGSAGAGGAGAGGSAGAGAGGAGAGGAGAGGAGAGGAGAGGAGAGGSAGAGGILVAGDMNIAPADLDVYDPAAFVGSTHVSNEERGRLREILARGLVDAYRELHPDAVQHTWWDYRAGNFHKGLGLRIDLILLSPSLAQRLSSCGIERDYRKGTKPSDHAPLVAELAD